MHWFLYRSSASGLETGVIILLNFLETLPFGYTITPLHLVFRTENTSRRRRGKVY